jgi:hypothetical protein
MAPREIRMSKSKECDTKDHRSTATCSAAPICEEESDENKNYHLTVSNKKCEIFIMKFKFSIGGTSSATARSNPVPKYGLCPKRVEASLAK